MEALIERFLRTLTCRYKSNSPSRDFDEGQTDLVG
jgi:hypothetical protein